MRSWIRLLLLALLLVAAMPAAVRAIRTEPAAPVSRPPVLRYGDRGPEVERLQRLLADRGYEPGPVDGIFGPLTRSAVLRAQSALELAVDGIVGRQTLSALQPHEDPGAAAAGDELRAATATALLEEGRAVTLLPAAGVGRQSAAAEKGLSTESGLVIHRPIPDRQARENQFALTFNGMPDPQILPRILEVLEQNRMQATFFIPGQAAVLRPELVARITAAGHEVGNGGLEIIDMSRLTPDMVAAQLGHAQSLITAASGQSPAFFRPPLGLFGATLTAGARSVGLRTALWTNIFAGSDLASGGADLAAAVYPGAVIMLHQEQPATAERLDTVLADLSRRGYTSVRLSRLAACEVCR